MAERPDRVQISPTQQGATKLRPIYLLCDKADVALLTAAAPPNVL